MMALKNLSMLIKNISVLSKSMPLLAVVGMAAAYAQTPRSISVQDEAKILQEAGIYRVGPFYRAASCGDDLRVELKAVDLNGDGEAEVILRVSGSPCFSGVMHSNVGVYMRSSRGEWRDTLGFLPAFGVRVLETKTKGFADIVLTVFGGCDPLFRWTSGSYSSAGYVPAYEGVNCGKSGSSNVVD